MPDLAAALQDQPTGSGPRSIMTTRVPVFEGHSKVWGYDLLLNSFEDSPGEDITTPAAQATALSNAFALVTPFMRADEKLILPVSEALVLDHTFYMFPQAFCCLNFTGAITKLPELEKNLSDLRESGYTLSVSCSREEPSLVKILPHAQIARVNIGEFSADELKKVVDYLKGKSMQLLAEHVTPDNIRMCSEMGFQYLQGDVRTHGNVVKGKKFSASQIIKSKLLKALANPDWSVKDVAELIRVDVSLSYRLLRYLNSAYFSLPTTVTSIESCIVLLGRVGVEQWIYVTIFSDLGVGPLAKHIINTAAFRGKFLEILGETSSNKTPSADSLFMLGLFSMLEALLSMPLEDIAKEINIDDQITRTLQGYETTYQPWFSLMLKYERGEWDQVRELGGNLGLSLRSLSSAYTRAMSWMTTLFEQEAAS